MGIYIKGMEMPKNCDKCLYSSWSNFYQIYVCNATRRNEPALFDKKQVKSTDTVRRGRADNCPLVPVPPHGRLIEAEPLESLFNEFAYKNGGRSYSQYIVAKNWVTHAPTIIEAEEGE